MPNRLLDSSILILAPRGQPLALDLMSDLRTQGVLYISVATRAEVLAGMRPHEETRTMGLLGSLISLPVVTAIADQAGRWIYQYARRGIQLSFPDALIGATALAHGLALVATMGGHQRQAFPQGGVTGPSR